MSRRVGVDGLAAAVNAVLDEYVDSVKENLDVITKEVAKAGVKALKAESRSAVGGTGKYASGWKAEVKSGNLGVEGVLYNGKVPGLPHLLEHGHAMRNGGRVAGRPHIAKVEQELIKQYEEQVKSKV